MSKHMYKPTSVFLADYASFEGQYPQEEIRLVFSKETVDGFAVEWKTPKELDSASVLQSQVLTGKYALDGLCLSLKDFSYTGKSDFNIILTGGKADDLWDKSEAAANRQLVLQLGNEQGTAYVFGCGSVKAVAEVTADCLKRENLVGKNITIEYKLKENGDCVITLCVDNQSVDITVCAALLAAAKELCTDSVRVIVACDDINSDFCLSFNGVWAKTDDDVAALMEKIENLPKTVDDDLMAYDVLDVRAEYDALPMDKKLFVINYPTLNDLCCAVSAREELDENGFDQYGFLVPTMNDISELCGDTPKGIATVPAKRRGVKVEFNNSGFGHRQYIDRRIVFEDVTVRFNNLNYIQGGFIVGVNASVSKNDTWNLQGSTGRFGCYMYIGKDSSVYITMPYVEKKMFKLVEHPLLSMDNLQNKEFFINYKHDIVNMKLIITFTVDGQSIVCDVDDMGTNPAPGQEGRKYVDTMDQLRYSYENAMVIVQSVPGYDPEQKEHKLVKGAFSIEWTGIKYNKYSYAKQAIIDEVVEAIDKLPDVPSLDIEDKVNEAWSLYFKLTTKDIRSAVTNYDKLRRLHDDIFALKMQGKKAVEFKSEEYVPEGKIDNTSVRTPVIPDSEIAYDAFGWPEWTKDCVVGTCRVETATEEGTFMAMEPVLKHFAEVGVNVLWLTPINDMGRTKISSTYCNYGPHTVSPYLAGQIKKGEHYDESKVDYEDGTKKFADFIKMAHKYNIRILVDYVPWGLANEAPIVAEHPDWFQGPSTWGGQDYHLDNPEVRKYYKDAIVKFMLDTDCDGIRWDLEPYYFGYDLMIDILNELKAAGKKPLFISEAANGRHGAYAFEQFGGVTGKGVGSQTVADVFFNEIDIVDAVKTGKNIGDGCKLKHQLQHNTYGKAKYYAYQISSHDVIAYRRASIASWKYQFIFGSFIPLFYLGEEWCTKQKAGSIYGIKIGWDELNDKWHNDYFETVKKLMALRWQYKDILNCDADDHRNTNICRVDTLGTDLIRGYARYKDNKAIVVVPNINERSEEAVKITAELPLAEMGLEGYSTYTLTDIMTDKVLATGTADQIEYFSTTMEHNTCNVYLLTANN